MPSPLPTDYQLAVQNPAHCFADPELRRAQPVLTPLGLPRVVTGNFACVFQLRDHRSAWAVRCFIRQVPDRQRRYAAIDEHLTRLHLPQLVDFDYQERGILVQGTWWPIVKMAWVAGDTLDDFVAAHLGDKERLERIAQAWVELVTTLEAAGVAHGDLQHGNVLVVEDRLYLVDYDGMFVPALRGQPSHELGHRNYQHPRRSPAEFDERLDRFSALAIYIALRALARQPALWGRFTDEGLLFARADFENPAASPCFRALRELPSPDLQPLVNALAAACTSGVRPPALAELLRRPSRVAGTGAGSAWWRDFLPPPTAPRGTAGDARPGEGDQPSPPQAQPSPPAPSSPARSSSPAPSPTFGGLLGRLALAAWQWLRGSSNGSAAAGAPSPAPQPASAPPASGTGQPTTPPHPAWMAGAPLAARPAAAALDYRVTLQADTAMVPAGAKAGVTVAVLWRGRAQGGIPFYLRLSWPGHQARVPLSGELRTPRGGDATARVLLGPLAAPPGAHVTVEAVASAGALTVTGSTVLLVVGAARSPPPPRHVRTVIASDVGGRYHRPGCTWAQRISARNRRSFASPREAERHGFVPCRICRP